VKKRVVEEISPFHHYSDMSVKFSLPLLPSEGGTNTMEEIEKLAIDNIQNIVYQADAELLAKWIPVICSALNLDRVGECLIVGYSQYALGDHEGLKATLRLLEVAKSDSKYSDILAFETGLLKCKNEFNFGNFDQVDSLITELPEITEFPFNRANVLFSKSRTGLATSFYLQEREKFQEIFSKFEERLTGDFGSIAHYHTNSIKSMHSFLNGRYLEANEYALAALKLSEDLKISGAYSPFEAAYVLADTYLEFGEDRKSLEISEKFFQQAIKFNQYPWITAFAAKLSLIELQKGNISGALAFIRKGREAVHGSFFSSLLSFPLDHHELLIRLPLGDFERIGEILFRLPDIELTRNLKSMLEFFQNPKSASLVLSNLPDFTDRNKPLAMQHLNSAIELAIPNGYFRAFLNMPPEVKNILLDIAAEKPSIYLEKLSHAIRQQSSGTIDSQKALTKRELDILRRLGTNSPIKKIAESLHISNNTIKTHLKNLYRKLGVESREEAVARGKELSLL